MKLPLRLKKLILFILALILLQFFLMGTFIIYFRKDIVHLAKTYAKDDISLITDEEIQKSLLREFVSYESLVDISRDESGKVTSVSANSARINRFTNDLGLRIGKRLDKEAPLKKSIPVGSVTGIDMLDGFGPLIPMHYVPHSLTNANVTHTFEEAGINQTLHTVHLNVKVEMEVVIPFIHTNVAVTNKMPIAQTLIVGDVPNGYIYN